MNFQDFITKLQNLPDKHKKIIMWIIVAILGIIMVFFWFDSAAKRISKLGEGLKTIELPQIENQIPNTDQTSDWKTYKNDVGGYEIKHPEDLEINHNEGIEGTIDELEFYNTVRIKEDIYPLIAKDFVITTWNNSNNFTIQQIIDESQPQEIKNQSDFIVDNVKGKKITSNTESGDVFEGYVINKNIVYKFHCYASKIDLSKYDCSTFNQMLSTFKFTQ